MPGVQKIVGAFVLAAFALMAGSAICLASGQPSVMTDCGSQMNGSAMCPFMSASIPTVMSVIVVLTFVFVAIAAVVEDGRSESMALARYQNNSGPPPISFLDSTLKLISQGILHSRVFNS